MKKIIDAKRKYNNIKIPNELNEIINQSINKNRPKNKIKYFYTAAASFFLFILIGVNISETFAKTFSKLPILGEVISIISIHSKKIDNDKVLDVEIPKIYSNDENINNITNKINKEIKNIVNNYTKEAEQRILEYKDAFIETGGTEEEFNKKNIVVDVSYNIKSESINHLSLVLNTNENWANAYNVSHYYNINLNTGNNITLKDILGDNYIDIANKSIEKQIKQKIKEDENASFFGYGDNNIEGFKTVTDETNFYINEKGYPVIVFEKYEIAPGYMGQIEFEIKN